MELDQNKETDSEIDIREYIRNLSDDELFGMIERAKEMPFEIVDPRIARRECDNDEFLKILDETEEI